MADKNNHIWQNTMAESFKSYNKAKEISKDEFQKIFKLTREENIEPNTEEAWEKFKKSAGFTENKKQKKSLNTNLTIKIAACIVLFVGIFFLTRSIIQNNKQRSITLQVEKGTKNFTLPDNSLVTLNQGSNLSYKKEFNKRKVFFNGQAYFNIEQNKSSPFIIKTNKASVFITGTSFYLHSDTINKIEEIHVLDGKVMYSSKIYPDKEIILQKEESAIIQENEPARKIIPNSNYYSAWETGKLIFNNTKLGEIEKALESFYDIKINIQKEFIGKKFTGTFHETDYKTIIETIATSMGLKYEVNGNEVFLYN